MDSKSKKKANTILNIIIILAVIMLIGIIIGYIYSNNHKNTTAEDIYNELKNKIADIGIVVVYNEETDINNLLGRPNQYISKVTFEDKRLEQVNKDNEFLSEEEREKPTGGTIEVFANETDMKKRKEYIESIYLNMPVLSEYVYSKGNILLRLEKELTPEQAKEYEKALNEIVK